VQSASKVSASLAANARSWTTGATSSSFVSDSGSRLIDAAGNWVDRVLPTTPVRQYVLAFPYELSGLAATRPEVLAALSRFFWESLLGRYRE